MYFVPTGAQEGEDTEKNNLDHHIAPALIDS